MIQAVATVMIILLLLVLIWVFLSYYNKYEAVDTVTYSSGNINVSTPSIPNDDYVLENGEKYNYDNLIESIIQTTSGEKSSFISQKDIQDSNINMSGDKSGDFSGEMLNVSGESAYIVDSNFSENNNIQSSSNSQEIPSNNSDGNLVISSELETSSQEKQQVLSEIDEALKGLLEAVGKVEVVDEDRLNASLNSEVEQP